METNSTKVHQATRSGIRSLLRPSALSIRLQLIACFMWIVLLIIAGDAVAVWQYRQIEASAQRVSRIDQISDAVIHVHLDVYSFRDRMAALVSSHDTRQFSSEAASVRQTFLQHVDYAEQMLRATPGSEQDALISGKLESLRGTLPSQLDLVVQLATAGEWNAVQLRLAIQVQALIELSSSLVERVDEEAQQQRAKAIEDAQKARHRLSTIVPIAALLTLLAAAALGWYVTRAVTGPLSVLTGGAEALARGDFQHRVHLSGNNELAVLGNAFNYAAQQLHKLYEDVRRAERELREQAEQRLQNENVALREEIDKASMFEEIVGTSRPLQTVLSLISKVAPSDSSVLVTGETGTGKELVARAIHKRSRRSSRPFVSVNCAAIPRDLIGSELFGHEKGAFTGAIQRRIGRFELAEGGTIFLDEIGELPAETQIALLRVLQEREFERVGGAGTIRTNVRVIAATNRDLQAAIAAGTFRSDLYYRLNVFPIEIPPLRARREDIPLLVEYFIDRFARKTGKSFQTVNKKSLALLESYPWPGNIRELQNVIERSVIVCETENFSVDGSWLSRQPAAAKPNMGLGLFRKLPSQEKAVIEAALRESGGQVYGPDGAASKLGMPRSTLESKIRSLKIDKNRFKATNSPLGNS
jgi:DNA-binding NtrC family response regulator